MILKLILKEYKSKMSWKNIRKFLRYENWMIPLYFLIFMPSLSTEYNQQLLVSMGGAICITYIINAVVGNELPMMLYFCPATEKEKKNYFRMALAVRIGLLISIYGIIMLIFLGLGRVDIVQAAEGLIFLCVSGIPPLLRVGTGLQREGLENFYGCDLCGHLLLFFGYFMISVLSLEFSVDNGEMMVLLHTLYGKIVLFFMIVLMLFYMCRFFPKVEEYVLDYERVRFVNQQKEKFYQGKAKKR